jgi:hypothetical protein
MWGIYARLAEHPRHAFGYLQDAMGPATADIKNMPCRVRDLKRQSTCLCHIVHAHKVSLLLAILKY